MPPAAALRAEAMLPERSMTSTIATVGISSCEGRSMSPAASASSGAAEVAAHAVALLAADDQQAAPQVAHHGHRYCRRLFLRAVRQRVGSGTSTSITASYVASVGQVERACLAAATRSLSSPAAVSAGATPPPRRGCLRPAGTRGLPATKL